MPSPALPGGGAERLGSTRLKFPKSPWSAICPRSPGNGKPRKFTSCSVSIKLLILSLCDEEATASDSNDTPADRRKSNQTLLWRGYGRSDPWRERFQGSVRWDPRYRRWTVRRLRERVEAGQRDCLPRN